MSSVSRRGQPSLLNKLDQLIQQRTKKSAEKNEPIRGSSRSQSRNSANERVHIHESSRISKQITTKPKVVDVKWYSTNQRNEIPVCKPTTIRSSLRENERINQSLISRAVKPNISRGSTPSKSPVTLKPHFAQETESSKAHKKIEKSKIVSKSPRHVKIEERVTYTELEHEKDRKWRQSLREDSINVSKSIDKSQGKKSISHVRHPSNSYEKKYLLPSFHSNGRTSLNQKSPIKFINSNRLNQTELRSSTGKTIQKVSRSIVHDEDTSTFFGKSAADSDMVTSEQHYYSSFNAGREIKNVSNEKLMKILKSRHKPINTKQHVLTKVINTSNNTNNSLVNSIKDSKPQSRDSSKIKSKPIISKEHNPVFKTIKVVDKHHNLKHREAEFSETLPSKNSSKNKTLMQQVSTNDKLPTPHQSLAESDFVHLETLSENGMFSGRGDSEDEHKSTTSRSRSRNPQQNSKRSTSRTTKAEEIRKLELAGSHELSPPGSSRFKKDTLNNQPRFEKTNIQEQEGEHQELLKRVETLFNRDRRTPVVTATSRNQVSSTKKNNGHQTDSVVATMSYNSVTYH